MKKWLILLAITATTLFFLPILVVVQTSTESGDHTAREEQEGKEVWEKFQAKQIECKDFTDDNYAVLGEYFMGQSIGDTQRHAAMNQMMIGMMGKEGEEQMHIVMGKRLSGCDPNAQVPQNGWGFMPMMWMMGGGNSMMGSDWGNMMGGWSGFSIFGWLSMILFWVLLVLGVVALIRYLGKSGSSREDKTPLDILKERYARGEIGKKEFEEKKQDL
ncbi:SHOCT domain-containing protein [Candidatus Parcubacteria bacterium]|nr:MAG: SHOCT domain-containing protein [Candidatus Parcubacteria bacterium]